MAQQFGVIGLGVMGQNLALNVERNGFSIAVYDLSGERTKALLEGKFNGKKVAPSYSIQEFVQQLERPRKILMMINAGEPVDAVIGELRPYLEAGDIVIDGGNSNYPDTDRRFDELQGTGIRYVGMGVSGGEEGALWGPSIMPGGDLESYEAIAPVLSAISAKTDSGDCVGYIGKRSAGHFVKMCHNGIEYGDMQLIAEAYDLLRNCLNLSPERIAQIFQEWNAGELQSYLIEITSRIVDFPDDKANSGVLLDRILDSAGQKGTGKWTTKTAMDLGVPIPTITASVDARFLSALKPERVNAAKIYPAGQYPTVSNMDEAVNHIRAALYASKICSYAQGFALMRAASKAFDYGLQFGEIARIWKGGCIIRAVFLDRIRQAFEVENDLPNLLLAESFQQEINERLAGWRWTVCYAIQCGVAVPSFAASLAYFDTYRRQQTPANLVQAQRDYFGAHTYKRTDQEGVFHTNWNR